MEGGEEVLTVSDMNITLVTQLPTNKEIDRNMHCSHPFLLHFVHLLLSKISLHRTSKYSNISK